MSTQNLQKADKNYDNEVKEFLFKHLRHLKKYGEDIRAIDVQRGRDHGVGSYESLRQFCGLPATTKWDDWRDLMAERVKNIFLFQNVYKIFSAS
jgi:peroxidase